MGFWRREGRCWWCHVASCIPFLVSDERIGSAILGLLELVAWDLWRAGGVRYGFSFVSRAIGIIVEEERGLNRRTDDKERKRG